MDTSKFADTPLEDFRAAFRDTPVAELRQIFREELGLDMPQATKNALLKAAHEACAGSTRAVDPPASAGAATPPAGAGEARFLCRSRTGKTRFRGGVEFPGDAWVTLPASAITEDMHTDVCLELREIA